MVKEAESMMFFNKCAPPGTLKKSPGSNYRTVIAAEDSPSKCIHAVTTKKSM
jgi:hypothetical protein